MVCEGKNSVNDLTESSKLLNSENGDGIKSGVRNWISLRLEDKNKADQRRNRMLQIFSDSTIVETLTREADKQCMAFDVLAYNTVMNQQTKG